MRPPYDVQEGTSRRSSADPIVEDDISDNRSFCRYPISSFEDHPGDKCDNGAWRKNVRKHIDAKLANVTTSGIDDLAALASTWVHIHDNLLFYPFTVFYTWMYLAIKRAHQNSDAQAATDQRLMKLKAKMSEWMALDVQHGLPKLYDIKLDLSLLRGSSFYAFDKAWFRVLDHAAHHDRQDLVLLIAAKRSSLIKFTQETLQKAVDHLDKVSNIQFDGHVRLRRILVHITKETGIVPEGLFIRGVEPTDDHPVGGGGYADVYRGKYLGRRVALKFLRVFGAQEQESSEQTFFKEAMIWRTLKHANILELLGVHEETLPRKRYALVSPWMENGSLFNYLRSKAVLDRRELFRGLTRGMAYLHRHKIVHGDVTSVNVLVDNWGQPRIMDFGLAKVIDSRRSPISAISNGIITSNMRWLPPELLDGAGNGHPSPESDVYMYACVGLEIFSSEVPFHYYQRCAMVVNAVYYKGEKPQRPTAPELSDTAWSVLERCWSYAGKDRPRMEQIVKEIGPEQTDSEGSEIILVPRQSSRRTAGVGSTLTVESLQADRLRARNPRPAKTAAALLTSPLNPLAEPLVRLYRSQDSLNSQPRSQEQLAYQDIHILISSPVETSIEDPAVLEKPPDVNHPMKLNHHRLELVIIVLSENNSHDFSGNTDVAFQHVMEVFREQCDALSLRVRHNEVVFPSLSLMDQHRAPTGIVAVERVKSGLKNIRFNNYTVVVVMLSSSNKQIQAGLDRYFFKERGTRYLNMYMHNLRQEGLHQYLFSKALKLRAIMGGENPRYRSIVLPAINLSGTLLVGVDIIDSLDNMVTGSPSIAVLVANLDETYSSFPACLRLQDKSSAMPEALKDMIVYRLDKYHEKNMCYPERVLIFRYSSQNDTPSSIQDDIQHIKSIITEVTFDKRPITLVHYERPLSLTSQTDLPILDCVVHHNENNWPIEDIQNAMTAFAQMFNATQSHSYLPPPLYWASVALDRVKQLLYHDAQIKRTENGHWPEVVKSDLEATMFYI